jgi:hypothetical protein
MPLSQSKDKIFGDLAVPSTRSVGAMAAYGSNANALNLISSFASFTPIYTNVPRIITTLKFEVTTGASATGSPLIQIAMYNCRINQLAPSTQIANTLTTGIDPTTTGVKTITFSPTWLLPKGLSFFACNIKATSSNNTCNIRGYDGTGRGNALLGNIGAGFDGTNPTTQYTIPGVPYISIGENTALAGDYSSATIAYSSVGADRPDTCYIGVFLK